MKLLAVLPVIASREMTIYKAPGGGMRQKKLLVYGSNSLELKIFIRLDNAGRKWVENFSRVLNSLSRSPMMRLVKPGLTYRSLPARSLRRSVERERERESLSWRVSTAGHQLTG